MKQMKKTPTTEHLVFDTSQIAANYIRVCRHLTKTETQDLKWGIWKLSQKFLITNEIKEISLKKIYLCNYLLVNRLTSCVLHVETNYHLFWSSSHLGIFLVRFLLFY